MKYDFTSIIDRHGRDSIAVDGLKGDGFSPAPPKEGFDAIPMWVADMNFPLYLPYSRRSSNGPVTRPSVTSKPRRNIIKPSSAGRKHATVSPV